MTDPVTFADALDNICAIVADRPPWNIDAIDWLESHGLVVKCTMGPPHNWEFWELTDIGSRLYHNVCSHFKTVLDAHNEAGQLKPVEGIEPNGRKKVHNNTHEQTNILRQDEVETVDANTVRAAKGRGATANDPRGGRASKTKGP